MNSMSKPVVYLETSFVSYLTGWVSADEKVARDQSATRRWWEQESGKCRCVVSDAVMTEAREGDSGAVARRLEFLSGMESLKTTEEAERLMETLLAVHALPETAREDALHVALAAVHGADLLLTWNCKHIANPAMLPKIKRTLAQAGYARPMIATPGQMLKGTEHGRFDS